MKKPKNTPAVQDTIAKHLKVGRTNAEVLDNVRAIHPHTKLSLATINWHRNQLRRTNKKIPSDRQARRR